MKYDSYDSSESDELYHDSELSSDESGSEDGDRIEDLEDMIAKKSFPLLKKVRMLKEPWVWAEDLAEVCLGILVEVVGMPEPAAIRLVQPAMVQLLSAWEMFKGTEGGEALALMALTYTPVLAQVGVFNVGGGVKNSKEAASASAPPISSALGAALLSKMALG